MPRSITSTQQDHRSMSSSNQDSRSIPAHNEFKGHHHHQRMTSSMDGTSAAVQSLIKSSSAAADNHKQLARIAGGNVMANRALPAVPQPGSNDRGREENKGRASSSNDLAVGENSRSPSKLRRGRSVSNNK